MRRPHEVQTAFCRHTGTSCS